MQEANWFFNLGQLGLDFEINCNLKINIFLRKRLHVTVRENVVQETTAKEKH